MAKNVLTNTPVTKFGSKWKVLTHDCNAESVSQYQRLYLSRAFVVLLCLVCLGIEPSHGTPYYVSGDVSPRRDSISGDPSTHKMWQRSALFAR